MGNILISIKNNGVEITRESNGLVKLLQEPDYDIDTIYLRGYIKTDSSTYSWGQNEYGQIGNNSIKIINIPLQLSKSFNKISGSLYYTAGIDSQGKAWCWGNNHYGNLGNYSTIDISTPVAVYGNHTFCDIITGRYTTFAFDKNKKLWSWGMNVNYLLLGANIHYLVNKSTPLAVVTSEIPVWTGNDNFFSKISVYYEHALALSYYYDEFVTGTTLYAWGYNNYGCFGNNNTNNVWGKPSIVLDYNTHNFYEIAVGGNYHSLAIDDLGKAWAWGYNGTGQLGINSTINRSTPYAIYGNHTFCKIYGGKNNFSIAIDNNGKTWSWGSNGFGQLGVNDIINKSTPIAIHGNHTFCQISADVNHVLSMDNNNKAWGWGFINNLGINLSTAMPSGSFNGVNHTFCKIFSIWNSSFGIDNNGKSWSWGENGNYNLGNNSNVDKSTPVAICGNHTFCQISGNESLIISIDQNGKAWGWGNNTYGYLGTGVVGTIESTPVAIFGNHTFCHISVGYATTFAIDNYGKTWGWGYNINLDYFTSITPVSIYNSNNHTFCKISNGWSYDSPVLGIDQNGKAWGWGNNYRYQIGITDQSVYYSPILVYGDHTFCQISLGYDHTLAIDNNGKGWGWGKNYFSGAVGVDIYADTRTPMEILGLKTFCKISAGYGYSSGIDNQGKGWSWGIGELGQLGINKIILIGTINDILYSPTSIEGNKTFCQISLGNTHSLSIDNHNKGWSWGEYSSGQLGRTVKILTPISIS